MENEAIKRIKAGRFIRSNGSVLRTINIMRYKYERLTDVAYALPDLKENELLDSVNYLTECGYIKLRIVGSKQESTLSDTDFENLEAKLTDKGIKLLNGDISDSTVEV